MFSHHARRTRLKFEKANHSKGVVKHILRPMKMTNLRQSSAIKVVQLVDGHHCSVDENGLMGMDSGIRLLYPALNRLCGTKHRLYVSVALGMHLTE